ncbi:hypothetical protein M9Y10_044845 [Tritrichomonas musculus]|uniref:Uncharacterized protein n=1 Tax=Tritrichomonas musculus TaxID=1915356 RepID=A0ABR2JTX9_9EUKA
MEEQKFDISNPNNFVWHGPKAHDFDEETYTRLCNLRKQVKSTISRQKRKDYSKAYLIRKKNFLESLANQMLLTLDIYTAALKVDNRKLTTKNFGISASISELTLRKKYNKAKFQSAIANNSQEYENEVKKKSEEFQETIKQLRAKADAKKKEVEDLGKNARKYREWAKLNENFYNLQKKRVNLENSIRRMRSSNSNQLYGNDNQNCPKSNLFNDETSFVHRNFFGKNDDL